jgi:hypothetical protein
MRSINRHSMVLGLAVAFIATACGSDPKTSQPPGATAAPTATTTTATTTTTVATTAVETTIAATTTAQADDGAETAYATKAFNLPFDVNVPAWLPAAPTEEQPNFVTWVTWGASDIDRAVRVLIPVNVHPPGGGDTIPPPEDYLAYLLGQADHGAHFTDTTNTTVGGRPATIVTATVDDSLDGSLGCPEEESAAADCFGLKPEVVLRIAVIDTGDKTLLIWLRNNADNPTIETEPFEQMLTTIRFSDRPVEAPAPPPVPVATPLDGTYRCTITKEDALAHGTPNDKKPEILATFPWVFTSTLKDGTTHLELHDSDGDHDLGVGTYTVNGDQITYAWQDGSPSLTYTFSVDDDGTLHLLVPVGPMDPESVFVGTTKPWDKID